MQAGDTVLYASEPLLFGAGQIEAILSNGMILVAFPDEPRPTLFSPHELELANQLETA